MAITTAAALTAGSIAASAGGAAMSFKQAAEERRRSLDAEAAADKAIESAMVSAEKNFYDKLSIKKTPYQMEREAALAVSANAMEAAKESERGVSAAAGRLAMASNDQALSTTSRMTSDLQRLEQLQATEDARLENEKRTIMLAEAEGAGIAANEATNNYIDAMSSGVKAGTRALATGVSAIPLYTQSRKAKESANIDLNAPVGPYGEQLLAGGVQPAAGPNLQAPSSVPTAQTSASNVRASLMDRLIAQGVYTPESLAGMSDEEMKILLGIL